MAKADTTIKFNINCVNYFWKDTGTKQSNEPIDIERYFHTNVKKRKEKREKALN
jgi:hypothetical protein